MVRDFHQAYIRGTAEKAIVLEAFVSLGIINNDLADFEVPTERILLNTKVLKHLYDKKPAEEFDFIIDNLLSLIDCPDFIYQNGRSKRGQRAIVKEIKGDYYFCSLDKQKDSLWVVTVFRIRKANYLKNYELLWSRRSDISSS